MNKLYKGLSFYEVHGKLEPVCCKKQQKKILTKKLLNDTKLVLNKQGAP